MKILDGKLASENLFKKQKENFSKLENQTKLVILSIGHNEESEIYIKKKINYGERLGVVVQRRAFDNNVSFVDFKKVIGDLNKDREVGGIIIQLPAGNFDSSTLVSLIAKEKDVDGFSEKGLALPATGRGVLALLDFYQIQVSAKKAVVIGDSMIVGKPIVKLLTKAGAKVSICNQQTEDIISLTQKADILVFATGQANHFDCKYIGDTKPVIIDVGIKRNSEGKICGDTDFSNCPDKISAITPVPGGVGPMTVWALFENLYDLVSVSKTLK